MICFHHNDLDGRCAAAVVNKWYTEWRSLGGDARGGIVFREMDYKDTPNFDEVLDEEVAIVDFSFKPEVMAKLLAKTDRVIWCDHHKTAEAYDYGRELAGVRDFAEKGRAGCEVAWDFFFPNSPCPAPIRLLGDYDAWRLQEGKRTFAFYEGLKLYSTDPTSPIWPALFRDEPSPIPCLGNLCMKICTAGRNAIQYRDNYCREIMGSFGYETEIDGVSAYATNFYLFGSQGFVENWKKYPICIAYIHDGQRFTVSMYSETVDVGEICKRHGGGGHKGAAGFTCDVLPFHKAGKEKYDPRRTHGAAGAVVQGQPGLERCL